METSELHDTFQLHRNYWGLIGQDDEGFNGSSVYGFENISDPNQPLKIKVDRWRGGCFGFVQSGWLLAEMMGQRIRLEAGTWFTTAAGFEARIYENTRVAIFQRHAYQGIDSVGHVPYGAGGDLKYIDGCRDSVLVAPRIMGMPVLNALYAPPGVHQTMHTHPSLRAGIILKGTGAVCETTKEIIPLESGAIFFLPKHGRHKFRTDGGPSDRIELVAYHPDSDFGPTDEIHPMLNRTIVEQDGEHVPFRMRR